MTSRLASMAAAIVLAVTPSAAPAGDRVVARVGKAPVTHLEVLALQADRPELSYSQATDVLVERSLVLAWAARRGMTVSDRDVDAVVATLRKREGATPEQFEQALAADGIDLPTLRERIREQLLVNQAFSAALSDRLNLSDEQIEKGYRDLYPPRATLAVSHILLRVPEGAGAEETARRERQGAELLERIRAGLPFADAARQSSEDPSSAARGGHLGTFSAGELLPELERAAQGLSIGEAGGPVRTALGFHLLTVTERSTTAPPLEKVRDQVLSRLRAEREAAARLEWIAELRKESFIEVFPPEK